MKAGHTPPAKLSAEALQYFNEHVMWDQPFPPDVVEEAREYYRIGLERDEYNRGPAITAAWHYALGASRFMQKPTNTTEG